ncbi:MAG: hypothetical protein ABIG29_03625 [Candidatus Nealsonbacteria bacterium]
MKRKIWISVITVLAALALISGVASAAGGNVLNYPFTITIKPPPPPDIQVEQLTDPKLEMSQGESIKLGYKIINPVAQTRWATVQLFYYPPDSNSGISYKVTLDGNQYIMGRPFVIAPGSSRTIEFVFNLSIGQYPCRLVIDQVPEPPPETG